MRKKTKLSLLPLLCSLLLIACSCGPGNSDYKNAIVEYYAEHSRTSGGGTVKPGSITIYHSEQVSDTEWTIEAGIKSSSTNNSLAQPSVSDADEYNMRFYIIKEHNHLKVRRIEEIK